MADFSPPGGAGGGGTPGGSNGQIQYNNSGVFGGANVFVDAANILALRNGTAAQTFNVYNTFTDTSNYERGFARWNSNTYEVGTEAVGTGVTRALSLKSSSNITIATSGALSWTFQSAGHLLAWNDNTVDIGTATANRPRVIYSSSDINVNSGTAKIIAASGNFYGGAVQLGNNQANARYGTDGGAKGHFFYNDNLFANLLGGFSSSGAFQIGPGTTKTVYAPNLSSSTTWNAPAIATTAASGTGTVATLTFATQTTAYPVGSTVVVAGVTPTGYNGTFVVTASSTTSVSYTNTTSASQTVAGTVQQQMSGIVHNITDTASASTSLLADLQVGGVSKFNVNKTGGLTIGSAGTLQGDAANSLSLRNGTNIQTFNVYGSYTDASNYDRLAFFKDSNYSYTITPQYAGTGQNSRLVLLGAPGGALFLGASSTIFWGISTGGVFYPNLDNTYDIGQAANRVRNFIQSGYARTGSVAVASLPAAATAASGARMFVTDATASTFGTVVAGGGANKVPVYSDGTNWFIG